MERKRRKRKLPPEVRAELDERARHTLRLREERIAYHRAKLAEERERRQRPFWRRYWRTDT
jgi:hypothetical protein